MPQEAAGTAPAPQEALPPEAETPIEGPAPEEQLVQYASAWVGLSREAQRQEFIEAEARYVKSGSTPDLVAYAMLSVLRSPERTGTTKRVRNDLRRYVETAGAAGGEAPPQDAYLPVARVLLYQLDEREQTLAQLSAQNETLQRQLDELKAIEEQLRERAGPDPIRDPTRDPTREPIQATPR